MTPSGARTDTAPEIRRAQAGTWAALLLITVGIAAALFLDRDVDPLVHGLVATAAALQAMIAVRSWRSTRRRTPR
ncbi:MAG TPA: hypothetical protein VFG13_01535 [Blastococcus sp.]|nr:hypothetical protein [Blastococcus sp.]